MRAVHDAAAQWLESDQRVCPPLNATFSFWATVTGSALAFRQETRVAGAILLLLVGYGGIGVAWERTCACDLRELRKPPRIALTGVATHLPMAVAGHALLALRHRTLQLRQATR